MKSLLALGLWILECAAVVEARRDGIAGLNQWGIVAIVLMAMSVVMQPCAAHPGYPSSAIVRVQSDGHVIIHVRHDALAFALNETPVQIGDEPMRRLLNGPRNDLVAAMDEARERFMSLLQLSANGKRVEVEVVEHPTAEAIEGAKSAGAPVRLPIMLEFVAKGLLPVGTTQIDLTFPEVLGDVVMTIERPGEEPFSMPLRGGERSPVFELRNLNSFSTSAPPSPQAKNQNARPQSPIGALEVARRYVVLGVTHIIPRGLDHMLFVLGLFFLSARLRPLLVQVTTFTLAHSVTLTLATLGLVRLSPGIVEPVIAASIAFVAVENLLTTRVHPWRPLIVFAFGLVHGMGFAGALKDLGLPKGQLAAALVSFNIGVEIGQLAVIAAALVALARWRDKPWYRRRIAMPASALIACVGLWWTAQRVLGW